jgi:hypothetical protein
MNIVTKLMHKVFSKKIAPPPAKKPTQQGLQKKPAKRYSGIQQKAKRARLKLYREGVYPCAACGVTRPLTDFGEYKLKHLIKYGTKASCKVCKRKYNNQYRSVGGGETATPVQAQAQYHIPEPECGDYSKSQKTNFYSRKRSNENYITLTQFQSITGIGLTRKVAESAGIKFAEYEDWMTKNGSYLLKKDMPQILEKIAYHLVDVSAKSKDGPRASH